MSFEYGGGDSWAGYRQSSSGGGGDYGKAKKHRNKKGKGKGDHGDHGYSGDYGGGRGGRGYQDDHGGNSGNLWGNYVGGESRGDQNADKGEYRHENRRRERDHRSDRHENGDVGDRGDHEHRRSSADHSDRGPDRGAEHAGFFDRGDGEDQGREVGDRNGWSAEHSGDQRRDRKGKSRGDRRDSCTGCGKSVNLIASSGLCTVCHLRSEREDVEATTEFRGGGRGRGQANQRRPNGSAQAGYSGGSHEPEQQQQLPQQQQQQQQLPQQMVVKEYVAVPLQAVESNHASHSTALVETEPTLSMPSAALAVSPLVDACDELIRQAFRVMEKHNLSALCRILLKLSRLEDNSTIQQHPSWKDVLRKMNEMLQMQSGQVQPKDLCDFVTFLLKLQVGDRNILQTLSMVSLSMENSTPADISGMLWGFASMGVRNEGMMSVSAAEVVARIRDFDQRNLSKIAWSFAKCGLWNEQLAGCITNECIRKISDISAQSISHISWAMAQWGTGRDDLMDAIAEEAVKKIDEFGPAQLGMTAWSFASLNRHVPALMTRISQEAQVKISQFKAQDLAHLAWAYANLKIQDSELFSVMAEQARHQIKGALAPELTNIAWAYSKNSMVNEELMATIAEEAVPRMSTYKPAEVAMITWAFGVAGKASGVAWIPCMNLMSVAGSHVANALNAQCEGRPSKTGSQFYSAQQLAHIAWAFGALALRHIEFCNALSKHVRQNLSSFKAGCLANIAWSFAMVGFCDHGLLQLMAVNIGRDVHDLPALSLSRCAWAYRKLQAPQVPSLLATLAAEAVKKLSDFPSKGLTKLVDSTFLVPQAAQEKIQEEMVRRVYKVADFFFNVFSDLADESKRPDEDAYIRTILQYNMQDAGLIATPALLRRLGIGMPCLQFIDRCKQQHLLECLEGTPDAEFAAAEVNLSWVEACSVVEAEPTRWTWDDFIMRYSEGGGFASNGKARKQSVDSDGPGEESFVQMNIQPGDNSLLAVECLSRNKMDGATGTNIAKLEPTFAVLDFIHANLRALGARAPSNVTGSVQVFSAQVPSLSEIGGLHQFQVHYPSVLLEFTEESGLSGPGPLRQSPHQ